MAQVIPFPALRAINAEEETPALLPGISCRRYKHLQVVDGDNAVATLAESWEALGRLAAIFERWDSLTIFQKPELERSRQWLVVLLKEWQQEGCAVNDSSRKLVLKSNREIVIKGMPKELIDTVEQRLPEVPLNLLVLLH